VEAFDYIAVDGGGTRAKGSLSAPSARDARDMLRIRGLTPIELKPARSRKDGESGTPTGRIKPTHRVQATRQMAILIGADQPVEETVGLVAQQFEGSPLRAILLDVRKRVIEGTRLSKALAAHPKAFPESYTSMVASGEGAGTLGTVMERLATDLEAAQAMRRKILAATIYPIILITVAILVVALLMVVVVPKVVTQIQNFGETPPLLTRMVISLSEWIQSWGLLTLGAMIAVFVAFKLARRRPEVELRWSRFVLGLPFVGRLSRSLNAARFSRTLASLIDAGTPPVAAMETAKHTLTNAAMGAATTEAIARIREGSSISRALGKSELFPPLVIQMVAGGESSGDVGSMFDKSAEYLEDEFESATSIFLALLEPLMILLLAVVVLTVIAAIFLPILQLQLAVSA